MSDLRRCRRPICRHPCDGIPAPSSPKEGTWGAGLGTDPPVLHTRKEKRGEDVQPQTFQIWFTYLFIFFISCLFRGAPPAYGVDSEQQLPAYTTATMSHICDLHHSSQQRWISGCCLNASRRRINTSGLPSTKTRPCRIQEPGCALRSFQKPLCLQRQMWPRSPS